MNTTRRMILAALALLAAALLSGGACAAETVPLSPDTAPLSRDAALTAGDWTELAQRYPLPYLSGDLATPPSAEVLSSWWDAFGDETLTQLIWWALRNNRDLAVAESHVTEARAALGVTKAAIAPWLDNVDSWSRGKVPVNSTGTGNSAELYKLGVDASWEIDIFGGRREDIRAGVATLEAQYAALHSTWVTLSSELALQYLSLRTLQERLEIAMHNLALQLDTLEIVRSRYEVGLSDALALSQAEYTVETTRSTIPPIKANIEQTLNVIAILVGTVPGSMEEYLGERKSLPLTGVEVLVGIPANYLRQRPDIRAAERQLVAQMARKKSAEKDLLPRFYLLGSIGLESLSSGSLFSSDSYAYSFGPRITWPIFHGGAIRNNIRVQTAREEQLLLAYESTVLDAVAEVRNALVESTQELSRNSSLRAGAASARVALDIANDKYQNGLMDFTAVIDAQRALLSLEEQRAVSDGQIVANIVRTFKALGGGWAPLVERDGE